MRRNSVRRALGEKTVCCSGGFTLVELLVVIAAVSLLMVLGAQGVRRARNAAMEAACAQNLRQWGMAFMEYADDHNGYLPHPDDRRRDGGQYGSPSFPEHDKSWVDMLPPYLNDKPWRDYPEGKKPTGGFWQCPAARLLPDECYSYRPSVEGYHSYAMNSYLAHDFEFALPWGASKQPSFFKLTTAKTPSRTILLFEQTLDPSQGYGQSGSFTWAGYHTAEDARAAAERHARGKGLGGNVLHLDGSVRWRDDLWDKSRPNPRIPRRGDPTWFPYPY